jgi:hypothetical protein
MSELFYAQKLFTMTIITLQNSQATLDYREFIYQHEHSETNAFTESSTAQIFTV